MTVLFALWMAGAFAVAAAVCSALDRLGERLATREARARIARLARALRKEEW